MTSFFLVSMCSFIIFFTTGKCDILRFRVSARLLRLHPTAKLKIVAGPRSKCQKKSNDQRAPVTRCYRIKEPRSLDMRYYLVTGGLSSLVIDNIGLVARRGGGGVHLVAYSERTSSSEHQIPLYPKSFDCFQLNAKIKKIIPNTH